MKTALVSASDAAFFDLLLGLIQSVLACPESRSVDLSVLDVGLDAAQVARLRAMAVRVLPTEWDLDFPARPNCPAWFKALCCRPFFPKYFPEHELIISIDADAWLCDWRAMQLLSEAARIQGVAIVPELDRCYPHSYGLRKDVLETIRETYVQGFGAEAADRFATKPVFNCGVFAMRRDIPLWKVWQDLLNTALQRYAGTLVEQCALNVALYTGAMPVYCLPAWCNWNCAHAIPVLDPQTRRLLVPLLPHEPISICHLVDLKRQPAKVACTDGTFRTLPLTYEAVRLNELPPAEP